MSEPAKAAETDTPSDALTVCVSCATDIKKDSESPCESCGLAFCSPCFQNQHGPNEKTECQDERAERRAAVTEAERAARVRNGEIPKTAAELHKFEIHKLSYNHPNWTTIHEAQEILNEEVAYAKVLGRRGSALDEAWTKDEDDPRLIAWREAVVASLRDAARVVQDWRGIYGGREHTTTENLSRLAVAGRAIMVASERALGRAPKGDTAGMRSALERIAALAHGTERDALNQIARIATMALEAK